SSDGAGDANAFGLNVYPDATATGGYRLVGANNLVNNARWSPTAHRVCYNIDNGAGFNIRTSDPAVGSANNVVLSNTGHINSECKWSDDGTQVAYLEQTAPGGAADLEIRAGDAGSPARVLAGLAAQGRTIRNFEWRPGSNDTLAFIAERDTDNVFELYVVRAGGTTTKINQALPAAADVLDLAWSPDGAKLAYIADIDTDGVRQLYVANRDGAGRVEISDSLAGDEVVEFDWSADNTRLIYSAGPAARTPSAEVLYAATADGANVRRLNTNIITRIVQPTYAD
ncbi:MAG: PD40 domain-containing protein, partial [Parvularculaceae bacterium]|nr:PD40 domain-containing protein [Parvularculaceae bacterium]